MIGLQHLFQQGGVAQLLRNGVQNIQPAHIFRYHLLGFDDFGFLLFHLHRADRFIDARRPLHVKGGGQHRQHDAGNNQPALIQQQPDDAVQIHNGAGGGRFLRWRQIERIKVLHKCFKTKSNC